ALFEAMLTKSNTGLSCNVFEGAVLIVAEEDARRRVTGDVNVGPTVTIEVGCYRCKRVKPFDSPDARRNTGILERQVSAVVVEPHRTVWQTSGPAKHWHALPFAVGGLARQWSCSQVKSLIARDQQVEPTIAIVVQERAARTPLLCRSGSPSAFRDVL